MSSSSASTEPTIAELFSLSGRTALVTGAAGHLGRAIAHGLAEAGASVIATSRTLATALELAASLPSIDGSKHHGVELDQLDPRQIDSAIGGIEKSVGRVDILVNNAHDVAPGDWREVTPEQFDSQLRNVTGIFLLSRHVRNLAAQARRPLSVVMIGSMYGVVGPYPQVYEGVMGINPVAYQSAKGALVQLTRHLATCSAQDGVRVNCISPGSFPASHVPPELIQRLSAKVPMGRLAKPFELKGAVVFLASDASSYITGQNLLVDGGWTAW